VVKSFFLLPKTFAIKPFLRPIEIDFKNFAIDIVEFKMKGFNFGHAIE